MQQKCIKPKGQKIVERVMIFLHILVGVGALAGGLAAITNPQAPMGLPAVEVLKNGPFTDFLIPGIILFSIMGIGNLLSALYVGMDVNVKVYMSGTIACALIIWIVVQCIILETINFLHILFFIIGVVQGILASIRLFQERLFPVNLILKIGSNRSYRL